MRYLRLQSVIMACCLMIAVAFACNFAISTVHAQATTEAGAIQGTVTDPSGAAIPNAAVVLTDLARGSERTVKSSSEGTYSFLALVPGRYSIHVNATGFTSATTTIVVQVGQTANGNIKLGVQGSITEVQVEGTAVQVDTSTSTVEGVLDRQDIDNLPLNGRNFLDMAQLQPGVQIQDGTSFDPTKNGFSSISFGGRFGRTARITMDGIDVSDENVGTTTQNISEEAIQEFQIAESSLDISTSLTSSGTVNVVTRSGSNQFHGSGFYNFRDQRAGDADPVGYTIIPGVDSNYMQRNNMGGSFGGPFMKDKLFFFGAYEYMRQNTFNPVIFSGPLASVDGGYPVKFRETTPIGRLDADLPHDIHAFFRWTYDNNSDVAAFGGSNFSPFLNRDNTPGYGGGVDFVTGQLTHSVRAGYFKFVNHITDATTGTGIYNPTPGINLVINPFGFSSGANLLAPQATVQSNKQLRYDGSWIKGPHTLRYGVGIMHILGGGYASFFGINPQVAVNVSCPVLQTAETGPFPALGPAGLQSTSDGCGGTYGKATNPANYPVAGGAPNGVTFGNGEGFFTEIPQFGFPGGGQADWRFNFYVSDTWKFHRLAVNYGLRYVRDTGRDDADLAPIPLLDQVATGLGDTPNQPNHNFGPQLGFNYDLFGKGKTVITAGAGLYYENMVWNNILFDRPAKLTQGLFFGTEAFCPNGATYCGQPVGNVYQQIAAAQTSFQQTTKAAGPTSNGEYVGNAMAVASTEGLTLFSPNYKTPESYQINVGVQHEIRPGMVLSVNYLRSIGLRFIVASDLNHLGDARYLDVGNATTAINTTTSSYGCTTGSMSQEIDCAIAAGATIQNFAGNGLESENVTGAGFPGAGAAFAGANESWGQVLTAFPAGRSVYNALDLELQGQIHHFTRGLNEMNITTSYSYSRYNATGTSELGDADFIGNSFDNNHPTSYFGPTSLDRHNQFSIGVTATTFGKVQFSTIAHLYSSLPTTMFLPETGSGDIFTSDWTGSGAMGDLPGTEGAVVPGTNVGAFGRQYKGNNINTLINAYNTNSAGKLTPQGQAVVSAGLISASQMTELGGVMESLTAAPSNQVSNDILRTWDFTVGRDIKVLGEKLTITPTVRSFNILNAANYNNRTGTNGANVIGGQLNGQPGSPNGTAGHISEQSLRVSTGSGVFAEGSPRQLEFSLKLTF